MGNVGYNATNRPGWKNCENWLSEALPPPMVRRNLRGEEQRLRRLLGQ